MDIKTFDLTRRLRYAKILIKIYKAKEKELKKDLKYAEIVIKDYEKEIEELRREIEDFKEYEFR